MRYVSFILVPPCRERQRDRDRERERERERERFVEWRFGEPVILINFVTQMMEDLSCIIGARVVLLLRD